MLFSPNLVLLEEIVHRSPWSQPAATTQKSLPGASLCQIACYTRPEDCRNEIHPIHPCLRSISSKMCQTSFIRQSFLRTIPTNQHLLGIDLCSAPPTPFNLWYQLSTLCCEGITCVPNPAIAPHQALSVLHLGTNFSIVQHQFLMKLWIGVWSYHARNKLEVPQNRTATWLSFSRAKALNGNPENQQAWSPPGN